MPARQPCASIDQRNVGDDLGREPLRPHRLEELQCLLGKPALRASIDQRNVGNDLGCEPLRPHRLEELQCLLGNLALRIMINEM